VKRSLAVTSPFAFPVDILLTAAAGTGTSADCFSHIKPTLPVTPVKALGSNRE